MEILKVDLHLENFSEDSIYHFLSCSRLNTKDFFYASTSANAFNLALLGNLSVLTDRFCIVCFSEDEINLLMLARLSNIKITEIIRIYPEDIEKMRMNDILISYMWNIKLSNKSKIKFQVFKKVAGMPNAHNSVKKFKMMYNL